MSSFSTIYSFPNPELANSEGLLAVGGDLHPERIITAYQSGIFPWFSEGQPILWWSPDPRMILYPEHLKVSKSMKLLFKKKAFEVTINKDFKSVITHCANVPRHGQDGTWITDEMKKTYVKLHQMGLAYSVEVWQNHNLVGGLYGIYLKKQKVFCGESMFSKVSNASKFGFIWWVQKLREEGIKIIDCQIYTNHLASLGAREINRKSFLNYLKT